jgi:putative endonuclease
LGKRGEQAAARLLRQKGLVIVGHGESDTMGEIDLIAVDRRRKTLVFVEVKTLATVKPGHPAERVDVDKQDRITRAALRYLKRKNLLGVASRFDVVAVWWIGNQPLPNRIEHYEAAFEAHGRYQMFA